MRTEKKLLEIMLLHQELFVTGLCSFVNALWFEDFINYKEKLLLERYLEENKPPIANPYWWKPGIIQPRIDWINEQIAKLLTP